MRAQGEARLAGEHQNYSKRWRREAGGTKERMMASRPSRPWQAPAAMHARVGHGRASLTVQLTMGFLPGTCLQMPCAGPADGGTVGADARAGLGQQGQERGAVSSSRLARARAVSSAVHDPPATPTRPPGQQHM